MKKIYTFLLFLLTTTALQAQDEFIITWTITEPNLTVSFGVGGEGANFDVDYGDGTVVTNQQSLQGHTYSTAGTYTITITGTFPLLDLNSTSNFTISQWGSNALADVEYMFNNSSNFSITATDAPNLSQATSTKSMFLNANIGPNVINVSHWDVSTITNMESMFHNSHFNVPINEWDVSNVTNMKFMFTNNPGFNQPLNNWDVSNVTDMSYMFMDCNSFNQPLNDWDVSSVTNMGHMFAWTNNFNQPLDNWNVGNVVIMKDMFSYSPFNKPLDNWDVSNVTDMSSMFESSQYNNPLNSWDVSNVTDMSSMFSSSYSFNQPLDNWDVSNVINMDGTFGSSPFNQDLSSWVFNTDVNLYYFVRYGSLDTENYDKLLLRFVQLNLQNKTLAAHTLQYCDAGVRNYLIQDLGWNIINDSQSETCDGNTITGTITYDMDNNGCDATDIAIPNLMVNANDGTFNYYTNSTADGTYNLQVMENTYTAQLANLPDYFTASPLSHSVTFTGYDNTETQDYCLTANQQAEDLNITLLPLNPARPGEDSHYKIVVSNMGTQTVNTATVTLNYDAAIQTYTSASQDPATNTTGQLTFTVNNIAPLTNQEITVTLTTFIPPTVNGGEIIAFTATVTPDTNDVTPNDNTFIYEQEVVNSYDPNDKLVLQGEQIYIEQAGDYLNYMVRFQNTGSASALKVIIKDELNPMLNRDTFTPVSASHNYQMTLNEQGELTFTFNNINLPHEAADAPGSNGYIAYKIKPVTGLQIGDIINGEQAHILFDYNLPIITNATATEVIELLNTPQYSTSTVKLYPNPATDKLYISTANNTDIQKVTIYNLQGRQLLSAENVSAAVDISSLAKGLYIVSVKTENGTTSRKFIKQ